MIEDDDTSDRADEEFAANTGRADGTFKVTRVGQMGPSGSSARLIAVSGLSGEMSSPASLNIASTPGSGSGSTFAECLFGCADAGLRSIQSSMTRKQKDLQHTLRELGWGQAFYAQWGRL